jgi:hypothetical protein
LARPPVTNEAFVREVDEELRKDQLAAAARRWGVVAIAAVLLGLAAFGGWLWWQHRAEQQAGIEGEQYQAALEQVATGQTKQAAAARASLENSKTDGYRAMAKLTQADLLLEQKDVKGAVARYAAVAGDASLGQPFRDLATLRQTAAEFDTLPPQQVVERLRPLAVPGSAWFGSAGEMTAIAQLRLNRRDLAGKLFGQIAKAEDVPQSIRQRAVQMAGLLGVDAAPSAGATPTP